MAKACKVGLDPYTILGQDQISNGLATAYVGDHEAFIVAIEHPCCGT
jgi:hypothetical protein